MNFKDFAAADLGSVFNTDEFADVVNIDGQQIAVVVDEERLKKKVAEYGGITTGMVLYYVPVSSLSVKPQIGATQQFNGRVYFVDDVLEVTGMYEVTLSQNRGE